MLIMTAAGWRPLMADPREPEVVSFRRKRVMTMADELAELMPGRTPRFCQVSAERMANDLKARFGV